MRKTLAVPAQMFSHAPELLATVLDLEETRMSEKPFEPVGERRRPRFSVPLLYGVRAAPGPLFLPEKPWRSQCGPADQHSVYTGFVDTSHCLVKALDVAVAEQQRSASANELRSTPDRRPIGL